MPEFPSYTIYVIDRIHAWQCKLVHIYWGAYWAFWACGGWHKPPKTFISCRKLYRWGSCTWGYHPNRALYKGAWGLKWSETWLVFIYVLQGLASCSFIFYLMMVCWSCTNLFVLVWLICKDMAYIIYMYRQLFCGLYNKMSNLSDCLACYNHSCFECMHVYLHTLNLKSKILNPRSQTLSLKSLKP